MSITNQRTALLQIRSFDANRRRKPARNSSYFRSITSQTRRLKERVYIIIVSLIRTRES